MISKSRITIQQECPEDKLISTDVQRVLGKRLSDDIELLCEFLAPFEEWALEGDFNTVELLQILKEGGVFKDLRIIQDLGRKLLNRYAEVSRDTQRIYQRTQGDKVERALNGITTAIRKLRAPERPLFSEILTQLEEVRQMAFFVEQASLLVLKRNADSLWNPQLEWGLMSQVSRMTENAQVLHFCSLMIFLAECRNSSFLGRVDSNAEETEERFKKYRWDEFKTAQEGRALEYTIEGPDIAGLKIGITPSLGRNSDSSIFEAFQVVVSFNSAAPNPRMPGFTIPQPVHFFMSLSRVHSDLSIVCNGYVSLKPLFEAYGLGEFYENLKRYIWGLVEESVQTGAFVPMVRQAESGEVVFLQEVETQAGAVQGGVQAVISSDYSDPPTPSEVSPLKSKSKSKPKKGVRRTTRNIAVADILRVLTLMDITHEPGGAHFLLKGVHRGTGERVTLSIPFNNSAGQNGKNSAPYIAQAGRVFGFTREEFLEGLSQI